MLSSVEQAFVGREEIRAPLKMPAWEAMKIKDCFGMFLFLEWEGGKCRFSPAYCACN